MKLPIASIKKINKTWIVLGAALVIGVIAAFSARSFLSTQMAEMEARGKGQTVDVLVAKMELNKGSVLSSANLAVRPVPIEYAHSTALKPEEFTRIDGQVIGYKVNKGEMIFWSLMESKKVPTFSARLGAGQRAITVAVDEINSISGMLEPGDIIDLMFTADKEGKKTVIPLLQSIQVMATGQRSVDDPKTGERTSFATVTLNTTPLQAKNVIIARESGKLTALLRNPEDKQPIGNKTYDLTAMPELKSGVRGPAASGIPVLYGGSGARFSPEALKLGPYRGSAPTADTQLVRPPPGAARAPGTP
ncbi:MAG: Flp pilus assembly protein CpaB [Pseudomonadota bacterium]